MGLIYIIQGDSERKVNILSCNIIDHCEKISSYEQVFNSELLPRWSCLNLAVGVYYVFVCVVAGKANLTK